MPETLCSNCGKAVPVDEAEYCGNCGEPLCNDCICETCENELNAD